MSDHVVKTWIVENSWTCTSCRAVNRGRDMVCKQCGSPREKVEEDVVASPDAPEVTDPALLEIARAGENWVCAFCGSQDHAGDGKCKQCGAGRELSSRPRRERAATPSPARQSIVDVDYSEMEHRLVAASALKVPRLAPARSLMWIGLCLVGAGALVTFLVWLFAPHRVHARVQSASWKRSAVLHERRVAHDEGWGSVSGAFNVSCERRFKEFENCHPHDCRPHLVSERYRCGSHDCNCRDSCRSNKNGFSTCSTTCSTCPDYCSRSRTVYDTCYDQCSVYDDWCAYDHYVWPEIAREETSGAGPNPQWPKLQAGDLQRLDRAESYKVRFGTAGAEPCAWDIEPANETEYAQYAGDEGEWELEVTHAGSVKVVGRAGR